MIRFCYLIAVVFMVSGMSTKLHSNYVVSNFLDLPDEDLGDGIYYPPTLRAAIQNANLEGVATKISFAQDNKNIKLQSALPVLNFPVFFEGKGLTLEPIEGASISGGLAFTGNNSHLTNVIVQNFNGYGIFWKCSDGLIENVKSINNAGSGLLMNHADRNQIGSNNHAGYVSNYFNGATGYSGHGISMLWCDDNIIEFCAMGHDNYSIAQPNSRDGIYLSESYRNIIRKNVISGNEGNGIYIDGDNNLNETLIENNIIGLDRLKGFAIPNHLHGINLYATNSDTIRYNIISGNKRTGIYIENNTCDDITIENNIVGTDKSTKIALPNGSGIRNNGTNQKILRNIISGNYGTGLIVSTTGEIKNNIIGLDSTQQFAVPNYTGVYITGVNISFANTDWDDANVIAGNHGSGIEIVGAATKNIWIAKNIIGANFDFSKMFPNGGSGIKMTHSLRDIDIENNVIASSGGHGIEMIRNVVTFLNPLTPRIYQKPNNIEIYGNYLGWSYYETDTARIGGYGIYMYSVDSINIYENYITGTDFSGIYLGNDSSRHVNIFANDIGYINNNELQRINGSGIYIDEAHDVYIGGYIDTSHYNYIQNCASSGIVINKGDSVVITNNIMHSLGLDGITIIGDSVKQYIQITGNTIGPADNVEEAKIQYSGIYIERGYDIEIGDIVEDDANNVISYCKEYGIFITDSSREVYSHANRFLNNALGGIALDSVINWYYENDNFNDNLDADAGSNGLQNTLNAEISKAAGDSIKLKAYFNGYPETVYGVEVYLAKQLPDSLKHQTQGDTFVERFNIVTDSDGNAVIDKTIKSAKIADKSAELPFVTALVFGAEGTSGFSHISYQNPIFSDIMIVIDTLESGYDEYGIITIESVIINVGNTIESNIEVLDTTSGVELLNAQISSGTTNITDNIFSANIPTMNPGDSVRFTTKSKAQNIGSHKRIVHVFAEDDMNLMNNLDSIHLEILPVEQNITLSTGWNIISSNVEPLNTSIPVIWDEVEDNVVIVKNNVGQIYYPEFGINDISNWNMQHGYQVYMSQNETLSIAGLKIMPELTPIALNAGWNIISYLRDNPINIEIALASLVAANNLIIAKDNLGNVFYPAFEINMIGEMLPGQGYQIYILESSQLLYPEN